MDGYLTWREKSMAVAVTYENWRCSLRSESPGAFDAYFKALDREEHAAGAYRRLLEQAAA
jgi:hypothetical protein